MAKSWASRHDSGLIDGHCIFGEIGNNGVAGLVVGRDGLILLVNFNTSPLRAWYEKDKIKRILKQKLSITFHLSLTFFLSR